MDHDLQSNETRAHAVLDNATLFSAANFLVRHNDGGKVRNVNLLGIAGLADALVMHQRITVDRAGWDYFTAAVPQEWLPSIEPMVDVSEFSMLPQEVVVEAVVKSSNSVLLGYALTVIDQITETEGGRDINTTYFSYTGSDLGRNRDEQELVSLLQEKLDLAIPDMHLHLRSYEHVSALQSLVRAIQYQHYAGQIGQAYIPHDYRGRILNVISRERTQPAFRGMWERLMARVSTSIKKQYDEKLDWTRPSDDGSFAVWERFQTPTFLAMALEKTKTVGDLFHHVRDIRNKARSLREMLERYTGVDNSKESAALALDIRRVAQELDSAAPSKPGSVFSVSVGLPASISLRMNLPSFGASKSVAFIRDIYDNHAIPLTLSRDMERVFGSVTQLLTLDPLKDVLPDQNVLDGFFERAQRAGGEQALLGAPNGEDGSEDGRSG